jgi:hypothetical protein
MFYGKGQIVILARAAKHRILDGHRVDRISALQNYTSTQ